MLFPDPRKYKTWNEWALSLVRMNFNPTVDLIVKVQGYTDARLPTPNEDGMVVRLLEHSGKPVYSYNGAWKYFSDDTTAP